MVEIKNVTKYYGENKAVDNISLSIYKGDVVGLLGPNGAGKSTTMKILTGFLIPDEGEVIIEGERLEGEFDDVKKKIGYMPESNPLFKDQLCFEALEFALDIHRIKDPEVRKSRIAFVVKATQLQDVYYKPISDLSKGFRQRVGLAVALIHDPKILVLDEPTEGLDPNQRKEIRDLIQKLGKERTVIISTHVMQEVEAMCNRIVIINKGQIVTDGSKDTVLKRRGEEVRVNLSFQSDKQKLKEVEKYFTQLTSKLDINQTNNFFQLSLTSDNELTLMQEVTKFIRNNEDVVLNMLYKDVVSLESVFNQLTQQQ